MDRTNEAEREAIIKAIRAATQDAAPGVEAKVVDALMRDPNAAQRFGLTESTVRTLRCLLTDIAEAIVDNDGEKMRKLAELGQACAYSASATRSRSHARNTSRS